LELKAQLNAGESLQLSASFKLPKKKIFQSHSAGRFGDLKPFSD